MIDSQQMATRWHTGKQADRMEGGNFRLDGLGQGRSESGKRKVESRREIFNCMPMYLLYSIYERNLVSVLLVELIEIH